MATPEPNDSFWSEDQKEEKVTKKVEFDEYNKKLKASYTRSSIHAYGKLYNSYSKRFDPMAFMRNRKI